MFREQLINDLSDIFEFEIIRNQSVAEGLEQDVLYYQITSVKEMPKEGEYYFSVRGQIGTHSDELNNRYGYLLERARLSKCPNKSRFRFSSREMVINMSLIDDIFIKTTLDFEYRVSIPFNPPSGEITYPKINWVKTIINKLKGARNA